MLLGVPLLGSASSETKICLKRKRKLEENTIVFTSMGRMNLQMSQRGGDPFPCRNTSSRSGKQEQKDVGSGQWGRLAPQQLTACSVVPPAPSCAESGGSRSGKWGVTWSHCLAKHWVTWLCPGTSAGLPFADAHFPEEASLPGCPKVHPSWGWRDAGHHLHGADTRVSSWPCARGDLSLEQ